MAKIDLKKNLGFSVEIEFDEIVSSEIPYASTLSVGISEMKHQLLNSEITCPDVFFRKYYKFDRDGIYQKKKISLNIIIVQSNLAGIEFVKTKGIRTPKYAKIIEVLNGSGLLIMQNFETNFEGDIITVALRKDSKVVIPPDYAYSIVNTRSSLLIASEICFDGAEEIDELDDMNGMSYYVIRKNAKQEIVKNPEYKLVSAPRKVKWESVLTKYGITFKTPVIKQILRKYDKFEWLFKEDSISV
jgi:oxalate decarboxylase/phosphoglucose isomerase-like protein (cupin superfamily)